MANNTYLFYGDKTELVECHKALCKLHEKVGIGCCVDMTTKNVVVHTEWIMRVEELWFDSDSFNMFTTSESYGNPVYWYDWVKTNFPNLKVAFMCEDPDAEIFEKVDPDEKFIDYIYICGSDMSDEDVEKLPEILRYEVYDGCFDGFFPRDEVFTSEFQPRDLPDSVTCIEYTSTTYDEIRVGDRVYLNLKRANITLFQRIMRKKTTALD